MSTEFNFLRLQQLEARRTSRIEKAKAVGYAALSILGANGARIAEVAQQIPGQVYTIAAASVVTGIQSAISLHRSHEYSQSASNLEAAILHDYLPEYMALEQQAEVVADPSAPIVYSGDNHL